MLSRSPKNRPCELGPYPLEVLERNASLIDIENNRSPKSDVSVKLNESNTLACAAQFYQKVYTDLRIGRLVSVKAPIPDDLSRRSKDIKGGGYFLDASHVGICKLPKNAWLEGREDLGHSHAIAILVEFGQFPEQDNDAAEWLTGIETEVTSTRAAEIAVILAGYIGQLGYHAQAHWGNETDIDIDRVGVLSGIVYRDGEAPVSPFVGRRYAMAVVTCDYEMKSDLPLSQNNRSVKGLRYFLGMRGAVSGLERWRRKRRASHLGPYPMETVKCVDKPTTLILDDEVPRIPQRALFYFRAEKGDLGAKMVAERPRWSYKHPFAQGILPLIWEMVKHQDIETAPTIAPGTTDAEANTRAIKSLSYYMGSAVTGICEVPDYAWYSHRKDGTPIKPYHKYAIMMAVDQGQDTFDGACGDDWISGSQSMRSYMRGAEIAGVMARHLCAMGHPSRPHTNIDSDVVHVPLMILAGLAEQSRVGEISVNPFIGPRFKSVVLTTDMPLIPNKPIDFGMQYFCEKCFKCARECPCNAIPYGDKIMFNGYETWKPDSERCTRYRFTNNKGSACGRCVKVCPLNKNTTLDGPLHIQLGSWLGVNAMWLKPAIVPFAAWLDDRLGNGNPVENKKWWLDLEIVDGVSVTPKGANFRSIKPQVDVKEEIRKQKIAYYPANSLPEPGEEGPFPADRKAALAIGAEMETPAEAIERRKVNGPAPEHYKTRWVND
jgi:ferredoxin